MRSPTPPPPRLKGWPVTDRFSAGAATCDSIPALSGLRCVELETSTSMVNARLNGERQCRSGRQRPEGSRPLIKRPLGAFDLAPRFDSCRGYGRGSAWRCAPFRAPRILLVVLGRRSAPASASPSRRPGNGILRAETGGRFQAQNAVRTAGIRFADRDTPTRLTNRPELRGFLPTRKPRRFAGTAAMQGSNLRPLRAR